MTTALVPVQDLQPLAATLAKSSLIPERLRGKEADVFVIILAGRELGLAPMTSLRSLSIIDGKPVIGSDAMVGIALASGLCDYFHQIESTDKIATYETRRKGDEPVRLSFTIEEAKAAGLTGKQNWKNYPAAMLRARAKAALARDVYSDALSGVYDIDEAREFAASPSISEIGRQHIEQQPAAIEAETVDIDELDWQLKISAAEDHDALRALREPYDALPECAAKERIAKLIGKRRNAITRAYADGLAKTAEAQP